MKNFFFIAIILSLVIAFNFFSCRHKYQPNEKMIAQVLSQQVNTFALTCQNLLDAVKISTDEKKLQYLFLQTRLAYKNFEWAAE
jgi:hypothetical protein